MGQVGACVMEWVSILNGGAVQRDARGQLVVDWHSEVKTDQPGCTNAVVTTYAIDVNDQLDNRERRRLAPLIPRLLRAGRASDWRAEARINIRLICWALRQQMTTPDGESVLDQIEEMLRSGRGVDLRHNDLRGEPFWVRAHAKGLHSAAALLAQNADQREVARELDGILMDVTLPDLEGGLVLWLSDLLDAHDKILADEGELLWDPEDGYLDEEDLEELLERLERGR